MPRWLVFSVGLMIAALAAYALLSLDTPSIRPAVSARSPAPAPAHEPIDDASRERLAEILVDAEPAEAPRR